MKNKSLVIGFVASSLILFTLFYGRIYYYDPLKIYHIPCKHKEYLQYGMRQQAAGIINNWDFDSIILGTSMLENTSAKEASQYLGGKFTNISISGSDFSERKIVLDYALRKKEIKKVLYSLDYNGLIYSKRNNVTTFDYLYDDNPLNDYINDRFLKCLFSIDSKIKCIGRKADFDRPNAWHKNKNHSSRFGGLNNWLKARNNEQIKEVFRKIFSSVKQIEKSTVVIDKDMQKKIATSKNYLNETIIQLAQKYPDTEFILFIPPYSRIENAIAAQLNKPLFKRMIESTKYLVSASKKINNLQVYGWGDTTYPDNIAHYKDLYHYEYKFNTLMLKYIKEKKGLLTAKNIEKYIDTLTKKSLNYNTVIIGKKIEKYLKKK